MFYFFGSLTLVWSVFFVSHNTNIHIECLPYSLLTNHFLLSEPIMLQQPRVSSIHHGWGKGIPATRTGLWKHEPEARLTTMASNTHQCAIFGIDYIHCNVAEYSWLLTQWSLTHALVTFQFGQDWSFTVIVIDLPKYMNDVLHFSIQDNGLYTSLPQLLKLIVSLAAGALSDWLIGNNYMSITNARKIYISLCEYSTFCQYPSTIIHD